MPDDPRRPGSERAVPPTIDWERVPTPCPDYSDQYQVVGGPPAVDAPSSFQWTAREELDPIGQPPELLPDEPTPVCATLPCASASGVVPRDPSSGAPMAHGQSPQSVSVHRIRSVGATTDEAPGEPCPRVSTAPVLQVGAERPRSTAAAEHTPQGASTGGAGARATPQMSIYLGPLPVAGAARPPALPEVERTVILPSRPAAVPSAAPTRESRACVRPRKVIWAVAGIMGVTLGFGARLLWPG